MRDLRVRWALEEAGLPYEQHLIGPEDQMSDWYRAIQPFGQVPSYEQDGQVLFESGAIVLNIAETSAALMPRDRVGRARVTSWLFAALNSIEPHVVNLREIELLKPPDESRRVAVISASSARLGDLSTWLAARDYLEARRFTAADLLMSTVLRILPDGDLGTRWPILSSYRQRCEARPAFRKALADHVASFDEGFGAAG